MTTENVVESEQALAGCLLLNTEKIYPVVASLVSADDFKDKVSGSVFSAAAENFSKGKPFDLVIACGELGADAGALCALTDVIPATNFAVVYAEKISEAGRSRRLKNSLREILAVPMQLDTMLESIADIHGKESRPGGKDYSIQRISERFAEEISLNRDRGDVAGVRTGFKFLDENFVRYAPGHVWVITGFTSTGKSKVMIEKVYRTPEAKTLMISTEMTETQIMARLYSRAINVPEYFILKGDLRGSDQQEEYVGAVKHFNERELKISDDTYELSKIEALVMQEKMKNGLDLVFIDYVQNCMVNGVDHNQQGAVMAKRLQVLAKRAECCIVCLSQVSNQVGRGDVNQFEAKGAGEWAAVADVGVRLKRSTEDKYSLGYDMQKARHYMLASSNLRFSSNFTRIDEPLPRVI